MNRRSFSKTGKQFLHYYPPEIRDIATAKMHEYALLIIEMLKKIKAVYDRRLQMMIEDIIEEARRKGIELSVVSTTCSNARCLVCLGIYRTHYPYFYIKRGGEVKTRYMRKTELVPLLKEDLGFDEKFVGEFLSLIDIRTALLQVINYLGLMFERIGLLSRSEWGWGGM